MKERYSLSGVMHGEGTDKEEKYWTQFGFIEDLAGRSASECVRCASTALRFRQLW